MQGLSSFNGTSSFLYTLNSDRIVTSDLTALNTNTACLGFHPLDMVFQKFANFESTHYFPLDAANTIMLIASLGVIGYTVSTDLASVYASKLQHAIFSNELSLQYAAYYSGSFLDQTLVGVKGLSQVMESLDVFVVGLEVVIATLLFSQMALFKTKLQKQTVGYDDVITLCQIRGLSAAEIFGLVTFALGLILFDMFVSLAEDDSLEAISYIFAVLIFFAVMLLFLATDVQFYFLVSSISGGELTLRVLYTDIVNNGLCLLRVFFCWIRYLFYDLQAELVDLAFHYTELGDEVSLEAFPELGSSLGCSSVWVLLNSVSLSLLVIFLDLVSVLFQMLIGAFKLMLALFLFWLILDLFLLRTSAHSEANGFFSRLKHRKSQRS